MIRIIVRSASFNTNALMGVSFLFLLTGLSLYGQTWPPSHKSSVKQTPFEQTLYAPIFTLGDPADSEIVLNNNSLTPLQVTPVLFTRSGQQIVADTILLEPTHANFLSLAGIIPASVDPKTKWGGISLQYIGQNMALGALITMGGGKSQSIDVPFTQMMDFKSQTLEAVWFAPRDSAATLMLGNSSNIAISVALKSSDGRHQLVRIAPFATEVIHQSAGFSLASDEDAVVQATYSKHPSPDRAEGVTLTVTGPTGSLRAAGFVRSADGSFTAMIRFYDPALAVQQNLYATNLRIAGGTPHLVLKNTSDRVITATPQFVGVGPEKSVTLPNVTLPARKSVQVDLSELQKNAEGDPNFARVSVRIASSGKAGQLIGALYNIADNRTYEVPLRDVGIIAQSTGGYPIRFEDDFSTIVSLTNVGNAATGFVAYLTFPNGEQYSLGSGSLQGGQTILFDLQKIRAENRPDRAKNTFPDNVTTAQFHWSMIGAMGASRLIGRAEITSASRHVSSSFSCSVCCPDSGPFPVATPDTFTLTAPLFESGTIAGDFINCFGQDSPPEDVSLSWSNSNPSVGSISQPNGASYSAQALLGGQTTFDGSTTADMWVTVFECCFDDLVTETAPIAMTAKPQITGITPSQGLVGNNVAVTIAGNGFGPNLTTCSSDSNNCVAVAGNVTVSNIQVNAQGTQIKATFGIPANAQSGGDQVVTVTSGGQTSNNDKKFHVQVPAKLVRLDFPGAPNGVGPLQVITDGNVVDLNNTVLLTHECGMYRNYAFDIEESSGTSINGTYTWTENFSNYSTTVSGLAAPQSKSFNFMGDGNVTDIQFFGTPAPSCPGPNDHESFDMSFTVTAGGTVFNISTIQHIDRGSFSGTPTVNATITTQ